MAKEFNRVQPLSFFAPVVTDVLLIKTRNRGFVNSVFASVPGDEAFSRFHDLITDAVSLDPVYSSF